MFNVMMTTMMMERIMVRMVVAMLMRIHCGGGGGCVPSLHPPN